MPVRTAEEPRRDRSQSVRSSASKLEGGKSQPERRRVTIAGAKGRRKMDRERNKDE